MKAPDLDQMSATELLDHLYAELRKLKNLVKTRRRRKKALELVTDSFLIFNAIAKRIAGMTFAEGPVAVEDEEDEMEESARGMPMAVMFSGDDDSAEVDADEVVDVEELRQIIRQLQLTRLDYFRLFVAYLCKDCRQEMDVTKRVVAIVRRVSPHLLQQFGITQPAVGRKFGQSRAAVSTREKALVEKPLKLSGARGILSNGARGEKTRRACARAAKGNQNRKGKNGSGSL